MVSGPAFESATRMDRNRPGRTLEHRRQGHQERHPRLGRFARLACVFVHPSALFVCPSVGLPAIHLSVNDNWGLFSCLFSLSHSLSLSLCICLSAYFYLYVWLVAFLSSLCVMICPCVRLCHPSFGLHVYVSSAFHFLWCKNVYYPHNFIICFVKHAVSLWHD